MSPEKLIQAAMPLVKEVGAFIRTELAQFDQKHTDIKSQNQLVSYVDLTAEKRLVQGLQVLTPEAGFVTEEKTVERNRHTELVWIVDPLDGTTNFIHALPVFSISVGLMLNGKLAGGIVYEINRDELFYAWEGGPAYMNGKEIHVTPTDKLENSLLATGFPYYDFEQMNEYLELLKTFMKGSRGLRRLGSAAVDLAYVACGRFDAFFEYSLAAWDVAAGAFIVQQAGGKVCDFSGGDDFLFGKEIVASNTNLHAPFLHEVKSAFKS
ncbi:MAG: inositol monophosphatase [Bacteroidetes bacterium]|nr:MAG: inositol monophosphatase [Bacteroidota bacterium]